MSSFICITSKQIIVLIEFLILSSICLTQLVNSNSDDLNSNQSQYFCYSSDNYKGQRNHYSFETPHFKYLSRNNYGMPGW